MECNLGVYVQRLEKTTGSNRTCCPAMGIEKDAYVKWPGSSAQEGQAHSFSTGAARKGITAEGGGRHERGREIRSPDVCSVFRISEEKFWK